MICAIYNIPTDWINEAREEWKNDEGVWTLIQTFKQDPSTYDTSYLEEKQKWVINMLGYEFEIIYKKGKKNIVSDAFSRKDEDVEAFFSTISII